MEDLGPVIATYEGKLSKNSSVMSSASAVGDVIGIVVGFGGAALFYDSGNETMFMFSLCLAIFCLCTFVFTVAFKKSASEQKLIIHSRGVELEYSASKRFSFVYEKMRRPTIIDGGIVTQIVLESSFGAKKVFQASSSQSAQEICEYICAVAHKKGVEL